MDDPEAFDGLALNDRLPFAWEPTTLSDAAELDHANQESARTLQAIAVFEEAPRDHGTDPHGGSSELAHLEAKIDVVLSLLGTLVGQRQATAPVHTLILRATSVEWAGPHTEGVQRGDKGYAVIYPNPLLQMPLRLGARVVATVERGGARWLMTRFEHLSPGVESGLEKLVFRRHRRQVALARGTGVLGDTGVFQMTKK